MRDERFPREQGIFPERWLLLKSRYLIRGEVAVTRGKEPTRLFCRREMSISDDVLKRAFGISPVRLLFMSRSTCRDELLARDSGMTPVRAFLPRYTYVRERLLPRDCGMLPVSWLLARTRMRSLGRFQKKKGYCRGDNCSSNPGFEVGNMRRVQMGCYLPKC
jgi:hypothetical protein